MRRRDFIAALGSASAMPLAARAQQSERIRRIGVVAGISETDADTQIRYAAFRQVLQELGWTDGRNMQIDMRLAPAGNPGLIRRNATELVALSPDVILVTGTLGVGALQEATRTIPIVFAGVVDPVGAALVQSLARPGGNITGFTLYEYGLSVKWLELLKEIAPGVTRVGVVRDGRNPAAIGMWAAMQGAAPAVKVELTTVDIRDAGEIERSIAAFVRGPNDGIIVPASGLTIAHRDQISVLAMRHRLPAVYSFRSFVAAGGLICYGPDTVDIYRRAAGYIDRILRGEKPAELPVQTPTKYELVINLKTAKALGLEIPPTLLARADEVIE